MVAKKTTRRGASTAEASAEKKEIPGWLWLGAGVAIGILITLLMNLNARRVAGGSAIQEVGQIVSQQNESPEKKPVFDFYTLLPESEVVPVTPKRVIRASHKPERQAKAERAEVKAQVPVSTAEVVATPARRYLLQVGSFRSLEDADRLRVRLLLWGFDARIERVAVKGGEAWHRVQLGPFVEQVMLSKAQQALKKHKLDSLILQIK